MNPLIAFAGFDKCRCSGTAEPAGCTDLSLFTRHSGNPILSRQNWPYAINSVFNAGAVRLADGDTLLLCRVEDRSGLSHLCAARSANGIDGWRVDPAANPDGKSAKNIPEEIWGIEDPRITYVPELKQYAVAYTSFARGGPGVSLALTRDFQSFERFGVIMPPEDKDAALLPRRVDGHWAMIHRPMTAPALICGFLILRICSTGAATKSFLRRGAAAGGMRTRLVCALRQSRPQAG